MFYFEGAEEICVEIFRFKHFKLYKSYRKQKLKQLKIHEQLKHLKIEELR